MSKSSLLVSHFVRTCEISKELKNKFSEDLIKFTASYLPLRYNKNLTINCDILNIWEFDHKLIHICNEKVNKEHIKQDRVLHGPFKSVWQLLFYPKGDRHNDTHPRLHLKLEDLDLKLKSLKIKWKWFIPELNYSYSLFHDFEIEKSSRTWTYTLKSWPKIETLLTLQSFDIILQITILHAKSWDDKIIYYDSESKKPLVAHSNSTKSLNDDTFNVGETDEIKQLNSKIDSILSMIQSQDKIISQLYKEIQHQNTKKSFDEWLMNECQLLEYYSNFKENGFDDISIIKKLTEKDLTKIGITKIGHRIKIMQCIAKLR